MLRPTFAIVTPTLHRSRYIRTLGGSLLRQSYPHWCWIVVHDGPEPGRLSDLSSRDPRFHYLETERPGRDFGASPRRLGAVRAGELGADYVVFWDDDNTYFTDALERIAASVARAGEPDCLLVPVWFRGSVLPAYVPELSALRERQLDTANLVLRPAAARLAYGEVVARGIRRATDYAAFDCLRRTPGLRLARDREMAPIGIYDGARPLGFFARSGGFASVAAYWLSLRRIRAIFSPRSPRSC